MLIPVDYQGYETSYTSYGAGGGTGGGGFIPGEGGSQQSPGGRRDYAQDSMRPVTIKQLLEATIEGEKDTCRIDNSLVTQVCYWITFLVLAIITDTSSSHSLARYATFLLKQQTPHIASTTAQVA